MNIHIPSESTLGAVVTDLDVPNISDSEFQRIYTLFLERSVVVFKQVHIDQEEHIRFSRRFGRLERTLSKRTSRPEISLLSNVTKEGQIAKPDEVLGLFLKGNRYWHSDSSFKVVGAKASLLRAVEVPNEGGDTEWADMTASWEALDQREKDALEGLYAIHSYEYSQSLIGGLGILKSAELEDLPPVEHPVVRTHPETGRKCLYLGRHISHVRGMEFKASQDLVGSLTDVACRAPRLFRHQWDDGDVVIWDNRCVLHRGYPWPFDQPRVMRRTTVAGEGDNPWILDEETQASTSQVG
ncbi:MAG: TauD/TfdA family dioxygenase [Gammaproteobacteria bacterium]|nr:TauD/TfdA family dioxygenase [Gammaproteobacteria bacterium]